MRSLTLAVTLGFVAALAAPAAGEQLKDERVHLVDVSPQGSGAHNFLFRGNMPINSTGFAYDQLRADMRRQAASAGLQNFPEDLYLHIVSFNNPFDIVDLNHELQFFRWYPQLGKTDVWMLVGNIVDPGKVPEALRRALAKDLVWAVDKIPDRVRKMHEMLATPYDKPVAFYVHCEAGCDRTGEFVGSYRLANMNVTIQDAWAANVRECGRPPNNFSKTALQWFCYTLRYSGRDVGDCEAI